MNSTLADIIDRIAQRYEGAISPGSRFILEVDLGREARRMGYEHLGGRLKGVEVVVPVKEPVEGMKVLVDGRTFIDYAELETGIAVPGRLAGEIGRTSTPYQPADSLVRQFH